MSRCAPLSLLLSAAALLTLPGAAGAATTIGGDPSQGTPSELIQCTDEWQSATSCTMVQESLGGQPLRVPAGSIITGWSGYFDTGSSAGLRLFERTGGGRYVAVDGGGTEWMDGGAQSFKTHVEVPDAGDFAIGLDLWSGSVAAQAGGGKMVSPDEIAWGSEPFSGTTSDYGMRFNVTYEPDADNNGLGDETEELPADPDPTPDPYPTPTPDDTSVPPPNTGNGTDNGSKDTPPGITFEPRGILGSEKQPYFKVYAKYGDGENYDVKVTLKIGGKVVSTAKDSDVDWGTKDTFYLQVKKPVFKKALRKKATKAVVSATLKGLETGKTYKQTANVSLLRGGASGFDGTYRGDGAVFVVKRGVLSAVSQQMQLFCPRSNQMMIRTMQLPYDVFPALIKKDGSFSGKGTNSYDTYTYKGTLKKNGTASGYFSLFYTNVTFGERLAVEDCFQASNWKAKKD